MNIEDLKKYSQILVVGHNKPDADSMISSKLLADILIDIGISAQYALLENNLKDLKINKVVTDCLDYKPFIVKDKDISKYKYFLVDHNDVSQSVNDSNLVVGAIDHHIDNKNINNAIFKEVCSTAIAIYLIFKDNYCFSKEQKKLIYHATLDDSSFGTNSRYKQFDKDIIKEIGFNPDFKDAFLKYFIPTNLNNLEYAFINSNHKKYNFNNIKFESTCIETIDNKNMQEYKLFIKNNPNNFLGLWLDFANNKTYTFFKYNDLYVENIYDVIASRSTIVINDTLNFLRRSGLDV